MRKIWDGVFDSHDKYGCGILTKYINNGHKIVIFRLKIIDLGAKLAKIINMAPKMILS